MDFIKSLPYPHELLALTQYFIKSYVQKGFFSKSKSMKYMQDQRENLSTGGSAADPDLSMDTYAECFHYLNYTSRSFAAVVQALDEELRMPICIFYLVLRGLDTVEDDMTIPLERRVQVLNAFWKYLDEPGWKFTENSPSEKDGILLQNFHVVIDQYLKLKPQYQSPIQEICQKMGKGMAEFANKKKVSSIKEWNLYCHYVAGLVGIGLCRMFAVSGLEDPDIADCEDLANSMGLFLQKVNIIRDYLEDLNDGRTFWPEEVWSQYAEHLSDFSLPENQASALNALNHLVCNAMELFPDCLEFLSKLRNPSVFAFCAIPQAMALATLNLVYNNPNIFRPLSPSSKSCGVKIRKGQACWILNNCTDFVSLCQISRSLIAEMGSKLHMDGKWGWKVSRKLVNIDQWLDLHSPVKSS